MKEAREAVVKIMERLTLADLRDRARRLEKPARGGGGLRDLMDGLDKPRQ